VSTRTQGHMSLFLRRTNSTRANLEPPLLVSRLCCECVHVARVLLCDSLDKTTSTSLSPGTPSGWEQRFMPCAHSRRSSLLLATSRAPIILPPLTSKDQIMSPSHAAPPCCFIDSWTGSTHVLFFHCLCCSVSVPLLSTTDSCLPAFLLTLTHLLLLSCHLHSSSTIEQTLRLSRP